MEGAQDLWRDRGAPSLGYRAGATLEVRFDSAAPQFHGLYDDQAGVIYVNQDLVDPGLLSIVIAHELGHAFGLLHIDAGERASVMNPGNLTTPPTDADQAAIEALWGACQ
jgi:Zn-dependent peptidase ImmA (M78 family)